MRSFDWLITRVASEASGTSLFLQGGSVKTKARVSDVAIRSVLLYGCETWPLKAADIRQISVFEHKMLEKYSSNPLHGSHHKPRGGSSVSPHNTHWSRAMQETFEMARPCASYGPYAHPICGPTKWPPIWMETSPWRGKANMATFPLDRTETFCCPNPTLESVGKGLAGGMPAYEQQRPMARAHPCCFIDL